MKQICFFRHGATSANLEGRYIGRTDAPLCETGVLQAKAVDMTAFPKFDDVFTSPYLRCRQTAGLLFPNRALKVEQDLRECDFGIFEGHTASELANSAEYAAWLASNCENRIPEGDDMRGFKQRCSSAVISIAEGMKEGQSVAIVTHGGCIMAVLEKYAVPKRGFYEYHVDNCGWVKCTYEAGVLTVLDGSFLR